MTSRSIPDAWNSSQTHVRMAQWVKLRHGKCEQADAAGRSRENEQAQLLVVNPSGALEGGGDGCPGKLASKTSQIGGLGFSQRPRFSK